MLTERVLIILWSEKRKIDVSGHNDKRYVRRNKDEAVLTVKHGSGSIMLWGCFVDIHTLHKVDGIINSNQ